MPERFPRLARLGLSGAHLAGWLLVALVGAGRIVLLPMPVGGVRVRLLHHAFDAGHSLAMGLVSAAVAFAWASGTVGSPARTRRSTVLGLATIAVLLSSVTLAEDFANFADRRGVSWARFPMAWAASLVVPAAWGLGALARGARWRRAAAVALAALLASANHAVLRFGYPGIHLHLAWCAAILAGSALTAATWPSFAPRRAAVLRSRGVRWGAAALATGAALASLSFWPPPRVLNELFKTEGSALVPLLARARASVIEPVGHGAVASRFLDPAYNRRRDDLPPTPPSAPSLAPPDPWIVLLTLDAVRADLLSAPRHRARLPHLAALEDASVSFSVARSPESTTRNVLASVFASKYGSQLRWSKSRGQRGLTRDPTPRLPEQLADAGFRTVLLTPYAEIGNEARMLGKFQEEEILPSARKGQRFALADQVLDRALLRLEAAQGQRLFLFMHWMDAHDPYDSVTTEGSDLECYLREVESLDRELGRLLEAIDRMGAAERTLLIVTADHGEALGAHGIPHHSKSHYEVLVRVPLLVRAPRVPPRRVDVPVTLMDLGPTILDYVGLPTPGFAMGQSLVPFLRGASPALPRPIGAEQVKVKTLVLGKYKVIDDRRKNTVEIYDLESDPDEARNLHGTLGGEDDAMVETVRSFFRTHGLGADADAPTD